MQHAISTKTLRHLAVLLLLSALLLPVPMNPQARASQPFVLSLPLIYSGTLTTPPSTDPEQLALERINFYRSLAGAQPLQLHTTMLTAARNHAIYDILNHGDPAAWVHGPHGEVAGKPAFTGLMPEDRVRATGFAYPYSAEVMAHLDDPTRSVDYLMSTVFHRIAILLPHNHFVGYGNGRSSSELVDVIDFGRGASDPTGQPGVIVYPASNQNEVNLSGASETPTYLPPGASYPVGYPITVQPIFGSVLSVSQAELWDASGAAVNVHPNPPGCGTACYALVPVAPLRPASTYTVHVAGTVDGTPFDTTWIFTTRSCPTPLDC